MPTTPYHIKPWQASFGLIGKIVSYASFINLNLKSTGFHQEFSNEGKLYKLKKCDFFLIGGGIVYYYKQHHNICKIIWSSNFFLLNNFCLLGDLIITHQYIFV